MLKQSTSHLKACSLLRQKGLEEAGSWNKGKKYIFYCITTALCSVYHSLSTMHELELNRTDDEQKPGTALYFS